MERARERERDREMFNFRVFRARKKERTTWGPELLFCENLFSRPRLYTHHTTHAREHTTHHTSHTHTRAYKHKRTRIQTFERLDSFYWLLCVVIFSTVFCSLALSYTCVYYFDALVILFFFIYLLFSVVEDRRAKKDELGFPRFFRSTFIYIVSIFVHFVLVCNGGIINHIVYRMMLNDI